MYAHRGEKGATARVLRSNYEIFKDILYINIKTEIIAYVFNNIENRAKTHIF
jgi:hypothetical protein